ncbi:MAG: hypothetical protein WC356_04270 [Candidatus Micrarchaeia archaeon]|jgi:hypothetical protein
MTKWTDKHPAIYLTLLFGLALAVGLAFGSGSRSIHETKEVMVYVNDAADTAQVYLFTPLFALDSYVYACSILTTTSPVDSQGIVYTTWAQKMKLSLKVTTIDTTRNYICSVATATTNYGIVWNPPETVWTAARAYDTLVYLINNKAGLKDSVKAEDSTTYIMLRSKVKQVPTMGGTRFTVWGDADTMRFDTASHNASIADICDGLAAAGNAVTDLLAQYTIVSEDTTVRITAKKKGLPFVWKNPAAGIVCPVDTLDTTVVQANVAGKTIAYDTIDLIQLITDERRIGGLYADIILHNTTDTGDGGGGASDSGFLYLLTARVVDTGVIYTVFKEDSCEVLPCTLHYALAYAAANDTIFKPILSLMWGVSDTVSDTTPGYPAYYDISIDITVLDQ